MPEIDAKLPHAAVRRLDIENSARKTAQGSPLPLCRMA